MVVIRRKRPVPPAVYNAARVLEQPIPSIEYTESERDDDETLTETTDFDDVPAEQDTIDSGELQLICSEEEEEVVSSSHEDVKPQVAEEDLIAFENLFSDGDGDAPNDGGQSDSNENHRTSGPITDENVSSSVFEGHESFMRSIQFESTRVNSTELNENVDEITIVPDVVESIETVNENDRTTDCELSTGDNETTFNKNTSIGDNLQDFEAKKKQIEANLREVLVRGVTVVIDDDLEYISIPGQQLGAIQSKPIYLTKSNDELSGNKPFKEMVSNVLCTFFFLYSLSGQFLLFHVISNIQM